MNPSFRPAYPGKMIVIATFQNLVLDKTPQKEIARQNGPSPHVLPSFGNTWGHKITLSPPRIIKDYIRKMSIIASLPFVISALVTMFNIWRQTSINVLFSRIIAATATITGWNWLLFFAITMIIGDDLKNVLTKWADNTCARFKETKERETLDDLSKKNAWWKSKEGKKIYERNKKVAARLVLETADFAHLHIKKWNASLAFTMAAAQTRNNDVVHIWDDKFSDMVGIQPREGQIETRRTPELANKHICKDCREHVDKIAGDIVEFNEADAIEQAAASVVRANASPFFYRSTNNTCRR